MACASVVVLAGEAHVIVDVQAPGGPAGFLKLLEEGVVVRSTGPGPEPGGNLVGAEVLGLEEPPGRVLQLHEGGARHQDSPIVPGGPGVLRAHAGACEARLSLPGVVFRHVVEEELAVVEPSRCRGRRERARGPWLYETTGLRGR